MKIWFALILALLVHETADAASDRLPPALTKAAKAAGVRLEEVGLVVQRVDARRPLLAYNAGRAMNPASTMKLVTTALALHALGPAYTWRTEILTDGVLWDGTLSGNLVIKGAGDPKLTLEEFWLALTKLRARGLRHINGDVVLDRSLIATPSGLAADFDGDPLRPYNALPDALLINFNAVRLDFIPRADPPRVEVISQPYLPALSIVNQLQPINGECTQWPQDPVHDTSTGAMTFSGAFPLACGETTRNYSPLPTIRYIEALFRAQWTALGGSLAGSVRDGITPAHAVPFVTLESEPLSEVIRDINKFSNNVMARQLFLSLGSLQQGALLTTETSGAYVRQWLHGAGMEFPELVMENGSGLSRQERIAPDSLARLLQWSARSPLAPEFIASLPISGIDGTMRKRLDDAPVAGRAHIKTGYLDGVRASAGYVLDRRDRLVIVVCIINGASANDSKDFHDAVIEWAHSPAANRPCCKK